MTDWPDLRERVWERCDGHSEATGLPLTEGWDLHHRYARSASPIHETWNLVAANHLEHVLHQDSIHQRPEWSRGRGLIISRHSRNPRSVGLWLPDGRLVRLVADGYDVVLEADP
jgi:hypothetical protein